MVGACFGNHHTPSRDEAREEAEAQLAFVGFPDGKAERLLAHLNLMELKRTQLARALACRPQLLLLDELTTGLNPSESAEAIGLIRKIRDEGTTVLLIEHVLRVITGVSDRVVVLDKGEKIADGPPLGGARGAAGDRVVPGQGRGGLRSWRRARDRLPRRLPRAPAGPLGPLAQRRRRRVRDGPRTERSREDHARRDRHGPEPARPRLDPVRRPGAHGPPAERGRLARHLDRAREARALPPHDRRGEPGARRVRPGSRRSTPGSTNSSRSSPSGGTSSRGPCPAASSRCSRSPARSLPARAC